MNVLAHPGIHFRYGTREAAPRASYVAWIPRGAAAAIAWSAFAIGGVYPWGYWPLLSACVICALAAFLLTRSARVETVSRALVISACAVAVVIAAQLLPVPVRFFTAERASTIRALDPAVAAGARAMHAASISPADTARGLLFVCVMMLLVAGLSRAFALVSPRRLAEHITVAGVLLAVVGIIQKPLYHGRLFGILELDDAITPFGPFINKNHFAGWMLMAIPMTLALLCRAIARGGRKVRPDWWSRVLWLSSRDANRIVLLAMAAAIMALSLVMTLSRSGIFSLALGILLTSVVVIRRQPDRTRKALLLTYLVAIAGAVVWWAGADAIARRFAVARWTELDGRKDIWLDALGIVRRFPLFGTGFNAFRSAALLYQTRALDVLTGEAHNDYLQLLAEGGVPLALAVAACLALFAREVRSRFRAEDGTTTYWLRVGAVTGLVAMALQETVEFSLQIPADAMLFAALCAIALHRPLYRERRDAGR